MSDSTFFDRFYKLCRQHNTSPNAVGRAIGASSGSITAWKQGAVPRSAMVAKIADYFGTSVDYLMGYTQLPSRPDGGLSNEELKFALFGGDGDITDEMLSEVLQFAQFIKQRK